jgi:NADH-quinone oxidoreductase subunit L
MVSLALLLPLAGTVVLLAFGKRIGEPWAGYLGSATVAAGFLLAVPAAFDFFSGEGHAEVITWFEWLPALGADAAFLWDPLSAVMTLVVTGVGALIHFYSIGYMHGDERYGRFFAYLNLFITSMLILVLGDNFAVLFVGWELVGVSSYLLISFWFERPTAAAAGKKAFVVNRVGDVGFLVALMLIFNTFGTLGFEAVFTEAPAELGTGLATAITLLLFVGAAGKSAQLPLYVWLPDAMEGPTPVSALIHAATMVTAGVYMVARTAALFELAPVSAGVVATVGAVTALYAATIAMAQFDIKRVLAYSTISQLGYMFMAVGAAAHVAGIFHLVTHAFFKALLFLGAGSVIHAMVVLWAVGLLTALLTAFYMTRLMFLTFGGSKRWTDGVEPHESPPFMVGPLAVLAVGSAVIGLVNTPWRLGLEHFLEPAFEGVALSHIPDGATPWVLAFVSIGAAVIGILAAAGRYRAAVPAEDSGAWAVMHRGYFVDDLYARVFAGGGSVASSWLAFSFDAGVIDGMVNGVGVATKKVSEWLRPLQTGFVRNYAVAVLIGTVGLLAWFLTRGAF